MYLENIYSPADVKKLSFQELNDLSHEIRASLLQKLSEHGGHFGPNFGMVEATIALHYVFNSPKDKIVKEWMIENQRVSQMEKAHVLSEVEQLKEHVQ